MKIPIKMKFNLFKPIKTYKKPNFLKIFENNIEKL